MTDTDVSLSGRYTATGPLPDNRTLSCGVAAGSGSSGCSGHFWEGDARGAMATWPTPPGWGVDGQDWPAQQGEPAYSPDGIGCRRSVLGEAVEGAAGPLRSPRAAG